MNTSYNINEKEIKNFENMADDWWNPEGKFKPLHELNPTRLTYIKSQICNFFQLDSSNPKPFEKLSVLDIGCGGGLIAEPICRLGASVTAMDAVEKNIQTAQNHAQLSHLDIHYIHGSLNSLENSDKFDVILCLEVIEHVEDIEKFIADCKIHLKPNGFIIFSTINRSPKSLILAKFIAEYILRWVPVGTHDWKQFVKPSELKTFCLMNHLSLVDITGLTYHPLKREWNLGKDLNVNYFISARPE